MIFAEMSLHSVSSEIKNIFFIFLAFVTPNVPLSSHKKKSSQFGPAVYYLYEENKNVQFYNTRVFCIN